MPPLELVPPELTNWLPVQIAGGLTFMAACAWFWRSLLGPVVHRGATVAKLAEEAFTDWKGEPERDGVPARPGVMARLAMYDERIEGMTLALQESQELAAKHTELLDKIKYHVMPNSGESAYDKQGEKIDDLSGRVGKLTDSQIAVAGAVDRLREDKERAHEEMLRRISRIERPHGEES